MSDISSQEQVCFEAVSQLDRRFRISSVYVPGEQGRRLLALHALFAHLDQVVLQSSDPYVAEQTLHWWRSETTPSGISQSRHPVMSLLRSTGAAPRLPASAFAALFETLESRLQEQTPASLEALEDFRCRVFSPRLELESALFESRLESRLHRSLSLNGGLTLLMLDSVRRRANAYQRYWWVPLDLLARHGVSREDLVNRAAAAEVRNLFRELLEVQELPTDRVGPESPGNLHVMLQGKLHQRLLARLQRSDPGAFEREISRLYLRDVFSVWRIARRLRA